MMEPNAVHSNVMGRRIVLVGWVKSWGVWTWDSQGWVDSEEKEREFGHFHTLLVVCVVCAHICMSMFSEK